MSRPSVARSESVAGLRLGDRDENIAVGALCVSFGVITFEMIGVNYIIPFIIPDLKLSNFQVGSLVSGFWVTFALGSYLAGVITDRSRARKRLVVYVLSLFSVLSLCSSLAGSSRMLLAARLVMGLIEGAFFLPPSRSSRWYPPRTAVV